TNSEGTQKIMRKYLHGDEKAIREAYTEVVLKATPKIPYPSKPGIQTLIDFLVKNAPEMANSKPDDFIDTRFVKELEDRGFYARLYNSDDACRHDGLMLSYETRSGPCLTNSASVPYK